MWRPYLVKDIVGASRLAPGQRRGEMEYEERIKILNWPTLEKRRHFISLIECYKIGFDLNSLKFSDFFEVALDKRTRANHSFKLGVKNAHQSRWVAFLS